MMSWKLNGPMKRNKNRTHDTRNENKMLRLYVENVLRGITEMFMSWKSLWRMANESKRAK